MIKTFTQDDLERELRGHQCQGAPCAGENKAECRVRGEDARGQDYNMLLCVDCAKDFAGFMQRSGGFCIIVPIVISITHIRDRAQREWN